MVNKNNIIDNYDEMLEELKTVYMEGDDWKEALTGKVQGGLDQEVANRLFDDMNRWEKPDEQWMNALQSKAKVLVNSKLFSLKKMRKIGLAALPPRQYILKRLEIEKGTLALLCAAGGSGKSWLIQYIACCVNSGKPLFDKFEVAQGRVLHIDVEQGENQTQRRYERLASGLGLNDYDVDRVELNGRLDSAENIKHIEADLTELFTGYQMVMIDSLKAVSEVDENSAQIEIICKIFKRVAEKAGCAIMLIHHKGKGKSDARQSGRGHSSIYDSVDVQIDINHEPDSHEYELICAKNRNGRVFNGIRYIMEDVGDFCEAQNCTEGLTLTSIDSELSVPHKEEIKDTSDVIILRNLATVGKSNLTELYEMVKGDRTEFNKVVEQLLQKEFITETRGARNARIFDITDKGKSFIAWS